MNHRQDLLGTFANHRVAATLLMAIMLLAGAWALTRLNTQFFPDFALDMASVRVVWRGASAEDVERAITTPLEQELRTVDGLKRMTSTSATGVSAITLEYREGTPMGAALDLVEERVGLVRELPAEAEAPEVSRVVRYEPVARILIRGPPDLEELRPLARSLERELLARGLARVEVSGLPEEEIAIQISAARLHELGLSLDAVAGLVAAASRDLPAGTVGRGDSGRQLRSLDQRRDVQGFADLVLGTDNAGGRVRLGDVATIERRPRAGEVSIRHGGRPAVELHAMRAESGDALESARLLHAWADERRRTLPPGVELVVFDQTWQLVNERILLLVKNGAGGLLLVLAILFLFLNARVAFWVAVGIPVSFMATLAVLYAVGGSINMISLFALIMALGIIVDDAIVVGEDALAHYQAGEPALQAAEGGARRMLAPVLSSSLTTVAAFLPLMFVGGVVGNILSNIPLVIVCVIVASLVESFLVLPGHLRHAFRHLHHRPPGGVRARLDAAFARFRDQHFRRLVTAAVDHRWSTLAATGASLVLCAGLLAGGRIGFTFFPNVESNVILANAAFAAGTPEHRVQAFLDTVHQGLVDAEQALGAGLVVAADVRHGTHLPTDDRPPQRGDQFGAVMVELVPSDARGVRNEDFIRAWRERVPPAPGLEAFTIASRVAGHPGRAIEIQLTGARPEDLKTAAARLSAVLESMPGVSAVEDNMPWGQQQLVYRLTPQGEAVGLSIQAVGRQLRSAFDGRVAQIFHEEDAEVEVRTVLPDAERDRIGQLEDLHLVLDDGATVPLATAVSLESRRGFEVLRHVQGELALEVFADVDRRLANENEVRAALQAGILAELQADSGITSSFEGKASDQRETMADMRRGMLLAVVLIYLILAWVFASYGWPLVVMAIIPFGLVGAVAGHFVMGIDLTILSVFGLFGLSGIVVNDSIILLTFYKQLREAGLPVREAVVEAACRRLRAVLLTSLTTIAGLTPLLFETSLQAQFLIPMAVSISFGLGFATLLVLLVIPALLTVHESAAGRLAPPPAPLPPEPPQLAESTR